MTFMTAWISPDATVSGNVTLGPGTRVMPGARIVAEAGGAITLGSHCIVLENAVIRATGRHPCVIGDHCLIGPHAHIVGATLADQVFIATGASVFHGASLGKGCEVRVNGTVHLRTALEPGTTVPIGWVAVGTKILSPDKHEEIWAVQKQLDFPGYVYGFDRETPDIMVHITQRLSDALGD